MITLLKHFFKDCFSILRSIYMVAMHAFSKRETRLYPDVPCMLSSRYRGRIVLTVGDDGTERCVACNLCAVVCPVGCISLKKNEHEDGRWYPEFFRINFSRCIFCGMCEEACPTGAIQLFQDFEMSDFKRSDLVYEKDDLLIYSSGKYTDYDFYKVSGVSIKGRSKGSSQNESLPVNVKGIMP